MYGCMYTGGPWDIAAIVLVEEAGGVVRSIDGGPFVLHMGKGKQTCSFSSLHPPAASDIFFIIFNLDYYLIHFA